MEIDNELLISFCDEAMDVLIRWERICLDLALGFNIDLVEELFRIAHNIKGGSRAVQLFDFGNYLHQVEDVINLIMDGKLDLSDPIQNELLRSQKFMTDWVDRLKKGNLESPDFMKQIQPLALIVDLLKPATSTPEKNQQHALNRESLANSKSSGTAGQRGDLTERPSPLSKVSSEAKLEKQNSNSVSASKNSGSHNETIRISAQKLDHILQTIGELSIHQTILFHGRSEVSATNHVFHKSLQLSQKLTRDLYDKALGLRMQPLESLFQRLERSTIELSRSLQKPIQFSSEGSEVELDKTVVEKIIDPLTHILRNAIDHGIETPEQRQLLNKSEVGRIEISAKQDTFGVLITIQDDGKGLDHEKIKAKAIEKNLLKPNQEISTKEAFQLIFQPGFSTAEKVTEVSGRGVGMDVVRKVLEDISGKIEIESQVNQGTKFSIILPTSVNIIEGMLVQLHGQTYVIPISAVDEVINVQGSETRRIHHSAILPIVDLRNLLQVNPEFRQTSTHDEAMSVVICLHRGIQIGFLVEKILGQHQVVIRPLNENIESSFGILGGTILGNGEPGLILDLAVLSDFYLNRTQPLKELA